MEGRIQVQVKVIVVMRKEVVPYLDTFVLFPLNLIIIIIRIIITLLPSLVPSCLIFRSLILLALLTIIIVSSSCSLLLSHQVYRIRIFPMCLVCPTSSCRASGHSPCSLTLLSFRVPCLPL